MDSHEGTYTKKFSARVEATFPGIVELDQTAFYHLGGGQPADCGVLNWDGGKALVNDVRKKNRIRHFTEGDSPEIGELVEGEIDWSRRYSHMRMHTSQHLVSAVVNELYNSDTVGNQIGAEKSRIDFKPLTVDQSEIEHIQEIVNDYISKDLKVKISEELRSNLENNKDIRSVLLSLKRNWISSEGPEVKKLEKKFSSFVNHRYGVAVSNGTAALEIAIKVLNLKPNDEVIIPNFTIFSNALAVLKQNLKLKFVDCGLYDWNMNLNELKKKNK